MAAPMTDAELDRSYGALLAVPSMGRLLLGMYVTRIAQSMVGIAIVLFTLTVYDSPALAGLATFLSVFPGLLASPIAGALLDRHGRTRLIVLDLLVALSSLVLLGVLALAGTVPVWLLLLICGVSSLTGPLSATGLRSLFPIIVPPHLWERVNALDSNGYVVSSILGPSLAAGLVAGFGGPVALIVIGLGFGLGAIVLARVPDPATDTHTTGSLLLDAWQGFLYTVRNPTLRALGFTISVQNLMGGAFTIVIPLIVLQRLHLGEIVVGLVFAMQGVSGTVSALLWGRFDSRGRERLMLVAPMFVLGLAAGILLWSTDLVVLLGYMVVAGALLGPTDIALFTLRQRRTDPAWTGRAFAVSMSLNYLGIPIGSLVAGWLATSSIDAAIALGVGASLVAGLIGALTVPREG
jgi:MFS family permease